MKTRRKRIGNEIVRTAVVSVRRNFIIGLVALLMGAFASLPVPNVKRRMMRFNPANT